MMNNTLQNTTDKMKHLNNALGNVKRMESDNLTLS